MMRLLLLLALFQACQSQNLTQSRLLHPLEAAGEWQKLVSSTTPMFGLEQRVSIRLIGPSLLPFQFGIQQTLILAYNDSGMATDGPAQVLGYREVFPERLNPAHADINSSFLDLSVSVWHLINESKSPAINKDEKNNTADAWSDDFSQELFQFAAWAARANDMGIDAEFKLIGIDMEYKHLSRPIILQPVAPLWLVLGIKTVDNVALTVSMASDIEAAMLDFVQDWLATNIETLTYESRSDGTNTMLLEFTVVQCTPQELDWFYTSSAATFSISQQDLNSLGCELAMLSSAMEELIQNNTILNLPRHVEQLQVVDVQPRPLPTASSTVSNTTTSTSINNSTNTLQMNNTKTSPNQQQQWVPWHLDRIDQPSLPLDGLYINANATGTGVNVYLISSGISATHQEFGYLDGHNGTRIKPLWGYQGLDPIEDCMDAGVWYSFGTFAASIIGGLSVGVAKNVTIHSVRMRAQCVLEGPDIWSPGGLPSALDSVLSVFESPGLIVIDTWWSRTRNLADDDHYIESAINKRLKRADALNIPIIVPVGPSDHACDNILANKTSVIRVSGTQITDHRSFNSAYNSSCIDIWAPGGGIGAGMTGASSSGDDKYDEIIASSFGASWIVAGVAAQYLQLYPSATIKQLKQGIMDLSIPNKVLGAGQEALNALVYTNLVQNASFSLADFYTAVDDNTTNDTNSLSVGAIIGIVLGCITVCLVAAGVALYVAGRSQVIDNAAAKGTTMDTQFSTGSSTNNTTTLSAVTNDGQALALLDWEIDNDHLAICLKDDGSPWLLGSGQWGRVYRGVWDGVTPVAIKTLNRPDDEALTRLFIKEIALMQLLSRDSHIVQFFGACVHNESVWLVLEMMEGGDLGQVLRNEETREAVGWYTGGGKRLALDIVRGIHFLHSNAVVHRDIKSRNILLSRDYKHAKIGDVGLAQIFHGTEYLDDGICGTFAYCPPEVLLNEKCTEKVDIYSFGVVLWELAVNGKNIPIRGALRAPVVPDECPQELVDIINACMSRDVDSRPSAKQLYAMLQACPPVLTQDDEVELVI